MTVQEKTSQLGQLCGEIIVMGGLELAECERAVRFHIINRALEHFRGNQSRAARALGVHRNTLSRSLEEMRQSGFVIYQPPKKPPYAARIQRKATSA